MKKRTNFEFGSDQMIQLKLEILLIEIIRAFSNAKLLEKPIHIIDNSNELFNYITINYTKNITLDELCFLFSTNKTTLCNSFKKAYGDSITSHINKLRIKESKKLMRDGKLNLTEISEAVGFSSIHYFSRCFKKYEKKSPTEYIKSVKLKLGLAD